MLLHADATLSLRSTGTKEYVQPGYDKDDWPFFFPWENGNVKAELQITFFEF